MAFAPTYESLPDTLPLFPLPQALLLPGASLPLNIFEPRYLAMTVDALATPGRLIGMVQPEPNAEDPDVVYRIGCAGRIVAFQETDDGRYLINLAGVSRYRVVEEVASVRGYRRFVVDWSPYRRDLDRGEEDFDVTSVKSALRAYGKARGLSLAWEKIDALPPGMLAAVVSQTLPFGPEEKQLLLEAESARERAELLKTLLDFGRDEGSGPAAVH